MQSGKWRAEGRAGGVDRLECGPCARGWSDSVVATDSWQVVSGMCCGQGGFEAVTGELGGGEGKAYEDRQIADGGCCDGNLCVRTNGCPLGNKCIMLSATCNLLVI